MLVNYRILKGYTYVNTKVNQPVNRIETETNKTEPNLYKLDAFPLS